LDDSLADQHRLHVDSSTALVLGGVLDVVITRADAGCLENVNFVDIDIVWSPFTAMVD
jgi:hypothetical protein